MNAGDPLLEFEAVSFGYRDSRPVLSDASFSVERGAFVLVKGDSGVGKSTLLRLCCALEAPDGGRILFRGAPLSEMDPPTLRRRICYVQQTPTVIAGSVEENLALPFSFKSACGADAPSREQMEAFLEEFRMSDVRLSDSASGLSVGQKQRLCLIRTLLMAPEAMLLDEPTSALDEISARIVLDRTLAVNREKGVTVAMVTHAPVDTGRPDAKILEIRDGKAFYR